MAAAVMKFHHTDPNDAAHGECIGTGSFGRVHRKATDSDTVVKCFDVITSHPRTGSASAGVFPEVARELAYWYYLMHGKYVVIPREPSDTISLVSPFMGVPLRTVMNETANPRLTTQEKHMLTKLLIGAATELWMGHRVVHMDIKPDNIVVHNFRTRGADTQVRFVDLGSAHRIEAIELRPVMRHVTTAWYEAPECGSTARNYSAIHDVWSLGVVLWELWMGRTLVSSTRAWPHGVSHRPEHISRAFVGYFGAGLPPSAAFRRDSKALCSTAPHVGDFIVNYMLVVNPRHRATVQDVERFALTLASGDDTTKAPRPALLLSVNLANTETCSKGRAAGLRAMWRRMDHTSMDWEDALLAAAILDVYQDQQQHPWEPGCSRLAPEVACVWLAKKWAPGGMEDCFTVGQVIKFVGAPDVDPDEVLVAERDVLRAVPGLVACEAAVIRILRAMDGCFSEENTAARLLSQCCVKNLILRHPNFWAVPDEWAPTVSHACRLVGHWTEAATEAHRGPPPEWLAVIFEAGSDPFYVPTHGQGHKISTLMLELLLGPVKPVGLARLPPMTRRRVGDAAGRAKKRRSRCMSV